MSDLPCSPAAERNKQPILEALQGLLPSSGRVLEIASGTGQHAAWMGAGLPGWTWQPTEANAAALPNIAARVREAHTPNVRPPCLLSATDNQWPSDDETLASAFQHPFDALFTANLLHIAPWAACLGLMAGAARHLKVGGLLLIYGPFFEEGLETAPGNLEFDTSLRLQNKEWGIRPREAVDAVASQNGLQAHQRVAMPANNLLLAYRFTGPGPR